MARVDRGPRHESDVLLRQIDGHLASLSLRRVDLGPAQQIAAALRRLIVETAAASAVDRARVRAAVHCFMLEHRRRDRVRVVNELLHTLGREDLTIRA